MSPYVDPHVEIFHWAGNWQIITQVWCNFFRNSFWNSRYHNDANKLEVAQMKLVIGWNHDLESLKAPEVVHSENHQMHGAEFKDEQSAD